MSVHANPIEVDEVLAVCERRGDSFGLQVVFDVNARTAMTNGKRITLPSIKQPVTREAMDTLYGFVIHECGHLQRPEALDILNTAQPSDGVCAIYNITEDDSMERWVGRQFRGDSKALGRMNDIVVGRCAESFAKKFKDYEGEVTLEMVAPLAVLGLSQRSRTDWDDQAQQGVRLFHDSLPPLAQELTDELVSEGWVDRMRASMTPFESWDLAIDLIKRLFPEVDDEQLEELRQKGHSAGDEPSEGDQEAGDSEPMRLEGDSGSSDQQGAAPDGKLGDEEGDSKQVLAGQGEVVNWKDIVLSEHDEWSEKQPGTPPGNIGIDWTDYRSNEGVALMPDSEINVVDLRGNKYKVEDGENWYGKDGTPDKFLSDSGEARAFGNQVRRYLQSQSRTKPDPEKLHGRLDKRGLIRLALPPIDGGEWNKRVFYDMTVQNSKDTCIHVLTDWSGSMCGTKMQHAADASGRLVSTMDRVLKIPVQLAAFTNAKSRCDIGLIKSFSNRSVSPQDIADRFSKFYQFSSANNDADAVMWAYRQLMKRKESRKILIVLSDGCPAGSWHGGNSGGNLTYVTSFIEQQGKVELYGVGIESSAVESYYTNVRVLNEASQINSTLFNIIKGGNNVKRNRQPR